MNFFDAMGLADKERIHSQFLFWFFNLEKDIIPDEVKHDFLKTFLDTNDCGYKDFFAYTEKSNIDIIIVSDKMALVIENKLKSSQHSKQTLKYDKEFIELCEKEPEKYKRGKTKKVLLSLINEKPESKEWEPITFHKLHEAFESIMPKLNKDIPEIIIINEYIKSIKELINTYDDFIKNYYNFPQIFEKKSNIKGKEEENEYIKGLRLGIIFQKGFFTKIMEIIEQSIKQCYKNKFDWRVDEENGYALLQIILKNYTIKNKKYFLGIQCQYKSFKINFQSSNYEKSEQNEPGFLVGREAYKKYMENKRTIFRVNPPQKHALISLSKKKPIDKFDIFKYNSFEALCDRLKEEIKETIPVIENIDSILRDQIKG